MRTLLLPLLAILVIAPATLGAASGPDPEKPSPAEAQPAEQAAAPAAEAAPTAEAPPALPLSPLMQEIADRLDRMRGEVRELEARFAATRDPQESNRLQRAIEKAKIEAELDVLRIQADHARREGRLEVVAEIEAAIELMTAPPATATARPDRAVER